MSGSAHVSVPGWRPLGALCYPLNEAAALPADAELSGDGRWATVWHDREPTATFVYLRAFEEIPPWRAA